MKRVPPSVRLKEEIEGLLGATEPGATTEEPPMVGFVGRLARYMLQWRSKRKPRRFSAESIIGVASASASAGATATNRNGC